ncbi:hypothetical protein, partial [Cellulomonas fimi]
MTTVSGLGPWPGADPLEAQTTVLGELTSTPTGVTGLPFVVQLPGRGYGAEPTGRGAALLVDLPAELGPHGWKLTDRPGRDAARARAYLREDLDALAVAAYGYEGRLLVPVTGPFTLAADLYLARGDRVLSDAGGVRELAESLGAGLAEHLDAVRAAVPGAEPVVLLSEPRLSDVLLARVPDFTGRGTLRSVAGTVVTERLRTVVEAARAADARGVVVHLGGAWTGVRPVVAAGADAIGLEVARVGGAGWQRVGEAVEAGVALWAGLAGLGIEREAGDVVGQADTLVGPWRALGLAARGLAEVVVMADGAGAGGAPRT